MTTYILNHKIAGRCVFASIPFKEGDLILENPVVPVTFSEIEKSELRDYSMAWTDNQDVMVLGNIMLLSHAEDSNCRVEDDIPNLTKRIYAKRDIKTDEHLTITYGCDLWFDPIIIRDASDLKD